MTPHLTPTRQCSLFTVGVPLRNAAGVHRTLISVLQPFIEVHMRHTALFSILTLAAAACASSPSSSNTASGPAPAVNTAPNPCSAGACKVVIEVAPELASQFQRQQANYKVYQGCPRSFGVSTVDGLRGVTPLVSSRTEAIPVPGGLQGKLATVAIFFGAAPARYALVDFSKNPVATVNFGYRWNGNALEDDITVVSTNSSFMTRSCR
jgi:hypothetical protein